MAAVGDTFRWSTLGTVFGEPVVNTYHYRISVVGVGDPRDALDTAIRTQFGTTLAAVLSVDYSGVGVNVQGVLPVTTVKSFTAFPTFGAVNSPSLPTQIATIITRKTDTPGRGGRGRLFMGAVPNNFTTGDNVTTTGITAYNLFRPNLTLTISSGGYTFVPVLFKRKTLTKIDLTSTTLGLVLKTRRSRTLGTRFHRRKRRTVGSIP